MYQGLDGKRLIILFMLAKNRESCQALLPFAARAQNVILVLCGASLLKHVPV